jgi:hypothetical protein
MLPVSQKGRPDYLAAKDGRLVLIECKEPGEPFTPEQMKTFEQLRLAGVHVWVLVAPGDALRFSGGVLSPWHPDAVERVWSKAGGRKRVDKPHRPGKDRARTVDEQCAAGNCATSKVPGSKYCARCGKEDAVTPAKKR